MHRGSCLCGNVKYEIDGELSDFGCCHCTSCRKASGSAFGANAGIERARFRLLSGDGSLREYESSPGKLRVFCSNCGSPMYAYLAKTRDVIRIRLGSLDTPLAARARAHLRVRQGRLGRHRRVLERSSVPRVGAARRAGAEGLASALNPE